MSIFKKISDKISNKVRLCAIALSVTASYAMVTTGLASGEVGIDDLGSAGKTLKKIISFVFLLSKVGGFVMTIFGLVQLVKYIQNHETAAPDALPKALGLLIGGVIMFCVKDVLTAIGVTF